MVTSLQARVDQIVACAHQPQIRVRRDCNGRPRYVQQCMRCGERLSTALPRVRVPAQCPPFDEAAEQRRHQHRNQAWQRASTEQRQQELSVWRSEHERYLRTPQWARLRAAVLRRADGTCEGCGQRRATQVHHLHYRRWQREMLFDLVAVCDICHRSIHEITEAAAS